MPVILPPSAWDTWLDPEVDDLDLLGELLVPAPSSLLTLHPVGFDVNNVRNNDAHLVDPVDPATRWRRGRRDAAARRDRSLTATFRRRVDNVILRWQGRLDSDQADRLAPWVVAIVLFLVLNGLALAQARSLDPSSDLAAYSAGGLGDPPRPRPDADGDHRLERVRPAGLVHLLPAGLADATTCRRVPLLLTVQSAALALAVIPIWRVCRRLAFAAHRRLAHGAARLRAAPGHPEPQPRRLPPRDAGRAVPDRGRLLRAVAALAAVRALLRARHAVPGRPGPGRGRARAC